MFRFRPPRSSLACFFLFAVVSLLVVFGLTKRWDPHELQVIASLRRPWLTTVMRQLSSLGNWQYEVPLALVVATLLWWRKRGTWARRYLATCLSGEALYALTKLVFHRPRPTIVSHLGEAGWYSYPSGHTMLALMVWGVGLMLVARLLNAYVAKLALWTIGLVLSLAIAASRLYLGVHYPSDVLGAVFLGLAWVLLWRDPVSPPSKSATSSAPATR